MTAFVANSDVATDDQFNYQKSVYWVYDFFFSVHADNYIYIAIANNIKGDGIIIFS